MSRTATIKRRTKETDIKVELDLDGTGDVEIDTDVGFLDHMLDQLGRHGLFDLTISAEGDLHIDFHHTVEDVGIAVGQAFNQCLKDKGGLKRFGHAYAPLDEALSRVVVDLSNRPALVWQVEFPTEKVGEFDTELFREWFMAFALNAGVTLHVTNLYGTNTHHIIESVFKAFAMALRDACTMDPRRDVEDVPSTKGTLSV